MAFVSEEQRFPIQSIITPGPGSYQETGLADLLDPCKRKGSSVPFGSSVATRDPFPVADIKPGQLQATTLRPSLLLELPSPSTAFASRTERFKYSKEEIPGPGSYRQESFTDSLSKKVKARVQQGHHRLPSKGPLPSLERSSPEEEIDIQEGATSHAKASRVSTLKHGWQMSVHESWARDYDKGVGSRHAGGQVAVQ